MNSINKTKPGMNNSTHTAHASYQITEQVVDAWINNHDVPLRVAEVASIDLSSAIYIASSQHKLLPKQIASMLYGDVVKIYTTNDQWHYQQQVGVL